MHEHQAHNSQVAGIAETGPEARHFIDRERQDVELGLPDTQPADGHTCAAQAHWLASQERLLKPLSDLTGSIRELGADGAIGVRDAVVDGGSRRRRLQAGLEAQVIEQCRLGKIRLGDVAGAMNTLPPANEVQQVESVYAQACVGQPADILAVQVPVDPTDSPAGGLLDYLNRAVPIGCGLQAYHAELHGRAASTRDWNCRALPPSTKKELGSCPRGRRTRRAAMPCVPRRRANCSAACWPLWLASTSKVR